MSQGREPMPRERQLATLHKRYERLAARLSGPGLLLRGTISEIRPRRPRAAGTGKTRTYGPYYQWTWKQAGRTVTVNLSANQRRAFQHAIDNQRRLEKTLAAMRDLSRRILEVATEGVPKRNR